MIGKKWNDTRLQNLKRLRGIVRIAGAEVNPFFFVFLRAVRVKIFLSACKCLYPGSKPGACLMPPRPSDPSLCSGQAKEGDRRAACGAGREQYGNGHSTRRDCLERRGNFLSLNNRTHGKADPFLRQTLRKTQGVLRTGALLRMTKRESGRGTEGKDPGSFT